MARIVCLLLQLYYVVLIVRIVFAWVPSPPAPLLPVARAAAALTDPLLVPLRRVIPTARVGGGAIDFSPIVLFLAIFILQGLFCG